MQDFKKVQIYNPLELDGLQKVVQLNFKDQPYLLYGGSFHSTILENFLKEQNIKFKPIQAPGSNDPILVPPLEGPDYLVLGMGEGALYFKKRLYTGLHDFSRDYKIGIDEEQRNLLKKTFQAESWTCF